MAEEKITNEEVLDDEDLENVAGGVNETDEDRNNFVNLGGGFYYGDNPNGTYHVGELERAFTRVGNYLGLDIIARLNYGVNIYYLEGKRISRDELWAIIKEGYAANPKVNRR